MSQNFGEIPDAVFRMNVYLSKKKLLTRGSLAKKKDNVFAMRPEKDIKVSAKVLRKCFVSSLILLWQPKSAQSALSSTVFKI